MGKFLMNRFGGKYRMKPRIDERTGEILKGRDGLENIYIVCRDGGEITHGIGNTLAYYIESKVKGVNILKKIYEDSFGKPFSKKDDVYCTQMIKELVKKKVIIDGDVMDTDVIFTFDCDDFDKIAKIVKPQVKGANVPVFSSKNEPKKEKHKPINNLPKEEYDKFLKIGNKKMANSDEKGKNKSLSRMKRCYNGFYKAHNLTRNKEYDIKYDLYLMGMWDSFLKYYEEFEI